MYDRSADILIPGEGPLSAAIMLIGEAGGEKEEALRRPFVGVSGDELSRYLSSIRLSRDAVYITNLVKTRPPNNADPTAEMIAAYEADLQQELLTIRPRFVVTLGRYATRWFLGPDTDMEREQGLPHLVYLCGEHALPTGWRGCASCHDDCCALVCVVPILHPAYGLYSHDEQCVIQDGWSRFGEIMRIGPEAAMVLRLDAHPRPSYVDLGESAAAAEWLASRHFDSRNGSAGHSGPQITAIDTEGLRSAPWCLTLATEPGTASLIRSGRSDLIADLHAATVEAGMPIVAHNLAYDWQVLAAMGFGLEWRDDLPCAADDPWWRRYSLHDTTEISYLLGPMYPQALKDLSYRVASMEQRDYEDLTSAADREMAVGYLRMLVDDYPCSACRGRGSVSTRSVRALKSGRQKISYMSSKCSVCDGDGTSWPKPVPLVLWENGKPVVWQPSAIGRRVRSILADMETGKLAAGKPAGPRQRWETSDPPEVREMVEDVVGPMPRVTLDSVPAAEVVPYASADADATLRIFTALAPKIAEMDLTNVYAADMAIIPLVVHMQQAGMQVDSGYFSELSRQWRREMAVVAAELRATVGYYVNPSSSKQVANLLFVKLRLPPIRQTKSRDAEATDAKVLEQLQIRTGHPAIALIRRYRELAKLDGTYARPLSRVSSADGRVRTLINTTRAVTGRLTSSKLKKGMASARDYIQMQNIPTRTEEGRKIRAGIVAREGYLLGSWDLAQIEMKVMAHCSRDLNLTKLFIDGAVCPIFLRDGKCNCHDIHRYTAALIWKIGIDEVTTEQRASAKNIGFGIIYGITAEGLQTQFALRGIQISRDEAQALIDAYLRDAYPGIRAFWEEKFVEARRYGYVRSESGRIRWATAARCTASWVREAALRELANFPIQEYAAYIIKRIMYVVSSRVLPAMWRQGYDVKCVMQIHDDIVLEFPSGLEEVLDPLMRHAMANTVRLRVPVSAEGKWGRRWSDLK